MHLLRYGVKCTVTDLLFNTQATCSKCPPSAWIHTFSDSCDQRTCKLTKHSSIADVSYCAENSLE